MNTFIIIETFSIAIIIYLAIMNYRLKKSREKSTEQQKNMDFEKSLKSSEESVSALLESAPILVNSFELHSDGKCLMWNKQCEKVFGYTIDEVNAVDNAMELFYPDEEELKRVIASLAEERVRGFEEWYPRSKSGELLTTIWSSIRLPNNEVINFGVDITEQRKREDELRESEERLKTMFDTAPVFIDAFDENGKCTLWNKECERVFGWSIDEINECENSLELFYPDKKDQQIMVEAFKEWNDYTFREQRPRTKDGKQLITMWAIVPMPDGVNLAIGYDITEQRKLEAQAKEKTAQLEDVSQKLEQLNATLEQRISKEVEKNRQHQKLMIQQSRHAQMGEILSMIAHQWRHPLNNLSLIIQDTVFQHKLDKLEESTIQRLDLESSKQIKQMSNTITEFKNFFKPEKESVDFNVSNSVQEAVDIMLPILEAEEITLILSMQENVTTTGYPTEIGQSVVNLLSNAKDAFNETAIGKTIALSLTSNETTITISIQDNAGGIDEAIIHNIFDPYFSTKSDKQGTGLGLYISKLIIEDHMKGNLACENNKNGALFTIELPSRT